MNQVKKLKQVEDLSYFDKNTLAQIFNLNDKALYENIQRWLKMGHLVQLKKGMYVTQSFLNQVEKDCYVEFIANKLRYPSYLSLEYVLQKHGVLTESVFAVTSITRKTKRIYRNDLGKFVYRGIKRNLFTGYEIKRRGEFEINEAKKSKALFDFLYLKLFSIKNIDKTFLDSLRLNLDEFTSSDKKEFSRYCRLAVVEKYQLLADLLFD